ncbi:MAG: substrate-binding domain-containing protein [Patulibacter sp.]
MVLLISALTLATAAPATADTIRVQSTTDTIDAGLVTGLLQEAYARAQPGDTLSYVGVGTGKALENARAGLADVAITHAPTLEASFVADGFSLEPVGRAIFYSDYVLVGPPTDPAGVLGAAPHDAVAALEQIAAAGAAGRATFVSRADNSGTNVQEQTMWAMTEGVAMQPAANGAGSATRTEPGTAGNYPAWYERTNKGQAANLQTADVCATSGDHPNGGCYTLVDRGTYNRLHQSGTLTQLAIVSEHNAAGARGGENLLINPFSAYAVNPDAISTDPQPNVAAALRLLDFLTSDEFQTALESFPTAADPAFRGDAFPCIQATLPTTHAAGTPLALTLTATDRLPGGGAVANLPVQLEASTDGGNSWAAIGEPAITDSAGTATVSASLSATAALRVSWPRTGKFSPSVAALGAVSMPASSTLTPTPTPAADTTKPRITKLRLTRTRVSMRLSEGATVRVTVQRQRTITVNGTRRHRYTTIAKRTKTATKSGTIKQAIPRLRAGRYKITVRATDAAGNETTRATRITISAAAH